MKLSLAFAIAVMFLAPTLQAGTAVPAGVVDPDRELFDMLARTNPAKPVLDGIAGTGSSKRRTSVASLECIETTVTSNPIRISYECGFAPSEDSEGDSKKIWDALKVRTFNSSASSDGGFTESKRVGNLVCTRGRESKKSPESYACRFHVLYEDRSETSGLKRKVIPVEQESEGSSEGVKPANSAGQVVPAKTEN